jgi:hypothetical protein
MYLAVKVESSLPIGSTITYSGRGAYRQNPSNNLGIFKYQVVIPWSAKIAVDPTHQQNLGGVKKILDISLPNPNPSLGLISVDLNVNIKGLVKLSVSNTLGEVIYSKEINVEGGTNHLSLDLNGLPAGSYTMRFDFGDDSKFKNIIINK